MILRDINIHDLQPAPYNPRINLKPGTPRFEKLKRSLETFELVQPIVWNEQTGHIVGGHQRVEVMKHLGYTTLPVVVVNLDLPHEQALNITLNNHQVGSDWDHEKLVNILEDLAELPDKELSFTGFDPQDLQDLCYKPNPEFEPQLDNQLTENTSIKVILDIPPDSWPDAEPHLNNLLASLPIKLTIHHP